MQGFEKVAQRSDIKEGTLLVVEVQGEPPIVVTELNGNLIAFSNICSHEECDFVWEGEGSIDGDEVECGCHGSRFNVLDGSVQNPPAVEPIPTYSVRVEGNDVLVGPR